MSISQDQVVDYIKNLKLAEVKALIETLEEELGVATDEIEAIGREVKEEIADAVRFAEESPPADDYQLEYKE